jgi:hypothetical protein
VTGQTRACARDGEADPLQEMGKEEPVVGVGQREERGGLARLYCTISGHADRSGTGLDLKPRDTAELAPVLLGSPLVVDR